MDGLDFDVAFSFAGEDRDYVDGVARALRNRGVKVFYDLFEEADLWGKDLYVYLTDVYQKRARFTVMFISKAYGQKLWTNHERRAAQARAFQEAQEYILPARFDETEIPGVLPTVGYISLTDRSPEEFASTIARKLVSAGGSVPTELVRKDFSIVSISPTAEPAKFNLSLSEDGGEPVRNASVTLQAANGTTINGKTDEFGRCMLDVQTQRLFRLLIAHPSYPATVLDNINPFDSVDVKVPRTDNVGSLIIHSTGYIPGLTGRLSPIKDGLDRTYIYADNIAVNGGKNQPVTFVVGQPIELEDADGTVVYAVVKHIAARVSLLQFTRRNPL